MIAEELSGLDDTDAAAVEKLIIGAAAGLTTGQLRALVRRAVLSADPKAARRRKEKALRDARVEMFPETGGTAALAGRDLPPAAVLAADKHLTALAQAMKAAGQPGTLDILRAWAYLHLLSGKPAATLLHTTQHHPRPATPPPATPPRAPGTPGDGARASAAGYPRRAGGAAANRRAAGGASGSRAAARTANRPAGQARTANRPAGQARRACPVVPMPERTSPRHRAPAVTALVPVPPGPGPDGVPAPGGLRGTVNLTMPLSAWLGWTEAPGDVPGYGPVNAEDSRTLARPPRQTRQPVVRHPHRHRRAPRRPRLRPPRPRRQHPSQQAGPAGPGDRAGPSPDGPTDEPGPPPRTAPRTEPGRHPGPAHTQPARCATPHARAPTTTHPHGPTTAAAFAAPVPDWLRGLTFSTFETGTCTHSRQSRGYQPSRALRHLICIRNPTCTGPGCRRAATRCDLDHVTPYHQGGRTCECNFTPPAATTTTPSKSPAGPSPAPRPAPSPGPPPETAPTPPPRCSTGNDALHY